jgi:hypothetical protein
MTIVAVIGDILVLVMLLWILYPWFVAKMNEPDQGHEDSPPDSK